MIQFPHCDPRILHAPGECEFCDAHADWQELRTHWGIAFTGHKPTASDTARQLACPADFNRGEQHAAWPGNRAAPIVEAPPPSNVIPMRRPPK